MSDEPEFKIERIAGEPEEWLRDFIRDALQAHAGRIHGVCIHLEVLSADDGGETSGCISFYNWPSSAQLQGRLHTTVTQLALRHLGLLS